MIYGKDITSDNLPEILTEVKDWSLSDLARITWEMNVHAQKRGRLFFEHSEIMANSGHIFIEWAKNHEINTDAPKEEIAASKIFQNLILMELKSIEKDSRAEDETVADDVIKKRSAYHVGWEIFITPPEITAERIMCKCWHIGYESGPRNWMNMAYGHMDKDVLIESYWGFDAMISAD